MINPLTFWFLVAGSLFSQAAHAHTKYPAMGVFYNGFIHPALSPGQVLLLITTGLFIGQQGAEKTYPEAIAALMLCAIAGLAVAWFDLIVSVDVFFLAAAATCGILVAANLKLPRSLYILIAGSGGLFVGMSSAQE